MNSEILAIDFAIGNVGLNERKLSVNVNLEKRMISEIFAFGIKYQWLSSLAMFHDRSKLSVENLIYLLSCSKMIFHVKYTFLYVAAEIRNNIASLHFALLKHLMLISKLVSKFR